MGPTLNQNGEITGRNAKDDLPLLRNAGIKMKWAYCPWNMQMPEKQKKNSRG